jgi:hypothetical protein
VSDPFLVSHAVGPLQFSIAGPLSPVSIRDQMIRGKTFVDRAIEEGLVSTARPLLIVGAGAGGATAAIRAAQRKVPATVIEASAQAFGRQRNCRSRWVDPTQYDWPVNHWHWSVYPWMPPRMPLPWAAQYSNVLAAVWHRELTRVLQPPSNLKVLYATTLQAKHLRPVSNDLEVTVSSQPNLLYFGAALFAVGFGIEQTSLGGYESFRFWETDDFEKPYLGLPSPPRKLRVLICGGGDGALQDFLRIVTCVRSAAEILHQLPTDAMNSVIGELQSAEDQAQRASVWCGPAHDHAVYSRLHQVYQIAVDHLFLNFRHELFAALDKLALRAKDLEVNLAHGCDHFTRCYGLNRFLVLLFLRYAFEARLSIRALPREAALSVTGTRHLCANASAAQCHGQEHEVQFQTAASCGQRLPNTSNGRVEKYDAVVLRIGVLPPRPFSGTVPMLLSRQLLPYHASQ